MNTTFFTPSDNRGIFLDNEREVIYTDRGNGILMQSGDELAVCVPEEVEVTGVGLPGNQFGYDTDRDAHVDHVPGQPEGTKTVKRAKARMGGSDLIILELAPDERGRKQSLWIPLKIDGAGWEQFVAPSLRA